MAGAPMGGQMPNINQAAARGIYGAGAGTAANMYNPLQTADIAAYQNPYTSQVIDQTAQDLERQRQMQQNAIGAAATRAGAFGGSREAIERAATNEAFARQLAQTSAGLRQTGFTQAQGAAQQDIANRLQAAGQLANISNLGFGMGQIAQRNLMVQGALQQALQQSIINAAKQQYGGYTGAGATGLGLIGAAGQGIPVGQTTTTSGGGLDPLSALLMVGMAPVTGGGSLFGSMLGGGAAAGAGAAGLGGGFSVASNPAMLSDIRLKDDINQIGVLRNGLPIYTWKWNDKAKEIGAENNPTIGVMAQEAMQVIPSAVIEGDDGYLRVNYAEIWK